MSLITPAVGRVCLPVGLSLTRAGVASWNPRALFAAGEQGAWYDPSDLSTLFQDSAGTTPVTAAGQPVGLLLDKRFGAIRGVERLVNGSFDSQANWGMPVFSGTTVTIAGGQLTITTDGTYCEANQPGALEAGKRYEVTIDVASGSGANVATYDGVNTYVFAAGTGIKKCIMQPATATTFLIKRSGPASTTVINSASVREIPGNHATQATTTARPLLQQDSGGRYYLSFDGVDDELTASTSLTAYPLTMATAAKAQSSQPASLLSVYGGVPPYYEISKTANALQWQSRNRGSVTPAEDALETVTSEAVPAVLIATFNATTVDLRANGKSGTPAISNNNPFGPTSQFRVGRGGFAFGANQLYGGIILARAATATEITSIERYLAARSGVTL